MANAPHASEEKPSTISPGTRVRRTLGYMCLGLAATGTACIAVGGMPWYLSLASYAVPAYPLLAAIGLMLCLHRPRQNGTIAAVISGICIAVTLPIYGSPVTVPPRTEAASLRLYVANVYIMNHDPSKVLNEISRENPDLVLLQEVDPDWATRLAPLESSYPHHAVLPRSPGGKPDLAVYWRGDTLKPPELLSDDGLPAISLSLQLDGMPVEFLNIHTAAPFSPSRASRYRQQMAALATYVQRCDTPLVIAGDLNATIWSDEYRVLMSLGKLTNARQGRGVLGTWPSFLGPLRTPLDHVLVSPEISVLACATGVGIGSDHRPLCVTVAAKQIAEN
ncbi:MAG: hypothetical protein GC168_01835 [Candidatus Hydrogenedens sp.]|nr:hypothetical protein [Candidatus Hydrogenedens sp.]